MANQTIERLIEKLRENPNSTNADVFNMVVKFLTTPSILLEDMGPSRGSIGEALEEFGRDPTLKPFDLEDVVRGAWFGQREKNRAVIPMDREVVLDPASLNLLVEKVMEVPRVAMNEEDVVFLATSATALAVGVKHLTHALLRLSTHVPARKPRSRKPKETT